MTIPITRSRRRALRALRSPSRAARASETRISRGISRDVRSPRVLATRPSAVPVAHHLRVPPTLELRLALRRGLVLAELRGAPGVLNAARGRGGVVQKFLTARAAVLRARGRAVRETATGSTSWTRSAAARDWAVATLQPSVEANCCRDERVEKCRSVKLCLRVPVFSS